MTALLLSSVTTKVVSGFISSPSTTRLVSKQLPAAVAFWTKHHHITQNNVVYYHHPNYPTSTLMMSTSSTLNDEEIKDIESQIKTKGDEIRQMKADGIDKVNLAPHIAELVALKAKIAPPEEVAPEAAAAAVSKKKDDKSNKKPNQKKQQEKPKAESEMSESELKAARLQKVELMRDAGVEPYEYTYDPTHTAMELQSLYEGKLEGGEEDEEADVAVAGRIMAKREFGKLAFFTLQDESGTIQLHLEKNRLGDSFKVCELPSATFFFTLTGTRSINSIFISLIYEIYVVKEYQSLGRFW